jgi:hypothetical protein
MTKLAGNVLFVKTLVYAYLDEVDLVKAFNTVPREAHFALLRRFGLADDLIKVVMLLHLGPWVKVGLGGGQHPRASGKARAKVLCIFSSSCRR